MFKCCHIVRFDDVDGAGIVYYPRYFHFCHKTFEDLFNQKSSSSYPELIKEKLIGFPTVHVEADYRKPFFYGDSIEVEFSVLVINTSSLVTQYKFFNSQELSFSALITVVCMDLRAKKAKPLTPKLRAFFEQFLNSKSPNYQ